MKDSVSYKIAEFGNNNIIIITYELFRRVLLERSKIFYGHALLVLTKCKNKRQFK